MTYSAQTYLPLRLGVRPKQRQIETDMRSEQTTVTTALNASPHFDLTISILPEHTQIFCGIRIQEIFIDINRKSSALLCKLINVLKIPLHLQILVHGRMGLRNVLTDGEVDVHKQHGVGDKQRRVLNEIVM